MRKKLIFVLIISGVLAMVLACLTKLASDHKAERQKYLRDSYSPLSDDPEIQEAYDEVRPDPYIIGIDTFAIESP